MVLLRTAWAAALLAAAPLLAQSGPPPAQVAPLTDDVVLTTAPDSDYLLDHPDLAVLGRREFLVSWDVSYSRYNGSQLIDWGSAISGRKVSFQGRPVGEEIPLDPFERHAFQGSSNLAADATGRFAVLWEEAAGLLLRRFDREGRAVGTRTLDHNPSSFGFTHAVAMDPAGRLSAAWTRLADAGDPGLKAQVFGSTGDPLTGPFRIPGSGPRLSASLAMDGRGISILAYHYLTANTARAVVRRFDATGRLLGREIVLGGDGSFQVNPAVAASPEGRFVVAWQDRGGIRARIFDSSGRKAGDAIRVSLSHLEQSTPDVAMDSRGSFVVVWQARPSPELSWAVLARLYNRDGVPQGGVFRVDPDPPAGLNISPGYAPAVAMTDAGTFLVVWPDHDPASFLGQIRSRLFAALRDDDRCVWRDGSFLCDTARDGDPSHFEVRFGGSGDTPLLADFDGDGDDDPCVRRGAVFLCDTAGDGGPPELTVRFGSSLQTPLAGDLDGDGDDDPCVRRGRAFLCDTAHNGGAAEVRIPLGARSDLPALGDVDGDGDDDPCVWRGSTGTFLCDARHDGSPDLTHAVDAQAGDRPLLGDVDGDGDADFCLARGEDLFCDLDRDGVLTQETLATGPGDLLLLGNVDGL